VSFRRNPRGNVAWESGDDGSTEETGGDGGNPVKNRISGDESLESETPSAEGHGGEEDGGDGGNPVKNRTSGDESLEPETPSAEGYNGEER
jgi:hypothetical protein